MSDLGEAFCDDGDIGIGAFGSGCADGLVGTASTGITFACPLGLGARAVFC